jgi:CspA family cold shock protein
MSKSTGKVKWFNEKKGYGFIEQGSGKDLFAHFSEIKTSGFKTLRDGQSVEFEIGESEKGLVAKNITITE